MIFRNSCHLIPTCPRRKCSEETDIEDIYVRMQSGIQKIIRVDARVRSSFGREGSCFCVIGCSVDKLNMGKSTSELRDDLVFCELVLNAVDVVRKFQVVLESVPKYHLEVSIPTQLHQRSLPVYFTQKRHFVMMLLHLLVYLFDGPHRKQLRLNSLQRLRSSFKLINCAGLLFGFDGLISLVRSVKFLCHLGLHSLFAISLQAKTVVLHFRGIFFDPLVVIAD